MTSQDNTTLLWSNYLEEGSKKNPEKTCRAKQEQFEQLQNSATTMKYLQKWKKKQLNAN